MGLSYVADCARCVGLCCVALPYARSADFPESKVADVPCRHLGTPASPVACAIHDRLGARGWRGCVAFHCAGAGPHVVHTTYGGRSWRDETGDAPAEESRDRARGDAVPPLATEQFAAFRVLVGVFEVGAYVAEARALAAPGGAAADPGLSDELAAVAVRVEAVAARPGRELRPTDPAELRALAGPLLRRTAGAVRSHVTAARPASRLARQLSRRAPGADLAGRDLRGADLRGADLTGALLLGADLSGADLAGATLLGADLRGARLRGPELRAAIFAPPGSRG